MAATGLPASAKWLTAAMHLGIEAQVFRGAAAGDDQGVVVGRLDVGEGGVEGEVVARLFAVGLVALEVVHGGLDLLAGLLAGADRVHGMADHEQGLERHHGFVVFGEITGNHQDFLGSHHGLLRFGWRGRLCPASAVSR